MTWFFEYDDDDDDDDDVDDWEDIVSLIMPILVVSLGTALFSDVPDNLPIENIH